MLARETVSSQDSGQHSAVDTRPKEPSIEANASHEEKGRTWDLEEEPSTSILRTGEEADFLRHRLERPMLLGRYMLTTLGAITAAAGFALAVATRSYLGYALGIFGIVLVVLGIVQHLLIRRERSSRPNQALLWKDGLELVLQNGEVHGLSWTDPGLALNVISRKAPAPANREYVLVCLSDPKVPLVELSAEGYELLRRTAEAQRLIVKERHHRRGSDPTRWVEIRQNA